MLQAKMKLIKLPSSDPAVLALQVSLCEQVLSVLDIVEPGITSRRGDILRVRREILRVNQTNIAHILLY